MAAWPVGAQLLSSLNFKTQFNTSCLCVSSRYNPSQITWDPPPYRFHWDGMRTATVFGSLICCWGNRIFFCGRFQVSLGKQDNLRQRIFGVGRPRSAGMSPRCVVLVAHINNLPWVDQAGQRRNWTFSVQMFIEKSSVLVLPVACVCSCAVSYTAHEHSSFCHMLSLVSTCNWNSFSRYKIQCTAN